MLTREVGVDAHLVKPYDFEDLEKPMLKEQWLRWHKGGGLGSWIDRELVSV